MPGFAVTTYEGLTPAVGILSAQSKSIDELNNSSLEAPASTLQINIDRYNLFSEPTENVDDQLVIKLDAIRTNKTSLVNTSTHAVWVGNKQTYASENDARSAAETVFGDTLTESEGMTRLLMVAPSVSGSISAGAGVSQINGAEGTIQVTQSYTAGSPFELIVRDVTGSFGIGSVFSDVGVITDCSGTDFVGTGRIYPDNVVITFYPNLEPPNSNVDNPLNPEELPLLDSGNSGVGVANTYYKNSLTTPASGPNSGLVYSTDPVNDIGYVYVNGDGQTPTISNLIANIGTGSSDVVPPNTANDLIKNIKKGYAINVFMLSRTNTLLDQRQADLRTAVGILEDPQYGGPY